MSKNCPSCNRKLLAALKTINDVPVSYVCLNCNEEYYKCTGDMLLTRKEFFDRKREEQ